MSQRKRFDNYEIKTARDPHRGGFWSWGWDGQSLWIKASMQARKWTKVNKIKMTPQRLSVIITLTEGQGLANIKLKKGSQIF